MPENAILAEDLTYRYNGLTAVDHINFYRSGAGKPPASCWWMKAPQDIIMLSTVANGNVAWSSTIPNPDREGVTLELKGIPTWESGSNDEGVNGRNRISSLIYWASSLSSHRGGSTDG